MSRWFFPIGLLVISLAVFLISIAPAPYMQNQFDFDASIIYRERSAQTPQFVHIQLSYPRWVRMDESGAVLVKIGLDGADMGDLQGWQARLEMNGVIISPHGESRQKAMAGKETVFRWNIRPYKSNAGRGTLWIYQVRENGVNHNNVNLIMAHPFEIQIFNWMGAAGWTFLRLLGGAGVLVSVIWLVRVQTAKSADRKVNNAAVSH